MTIASHGDSSALRRWRVAERHTLRHCAARWEAPSRLGKFMSAKSPDALDRLVGRNIRIQRLARGLSQTDVAEKLGVSFQQVQKYERGRNRIGAGRVVRIAAALEVSLLTLFEGVDSVDGPDGASPQALLAHPQHLSLVQAFSRVADKGTRRALIGLVRQIAEPRQRPAAARGIMR